MHLTYGYVKCKLVSNPTLKASRHDNETQYHLHTSLDVGESKPWDSAINVGTNDSDDLLQYKLIFDFSHPITEELRTKDLGFNQLSGNEVLPALDFLRSDILRNTGPWRNSDIMDGSEEVEPVASLIRLLKRARSTNADVYIFGREYSTDNGIHDVHMNQGSSGAFVNDGKDNHNDHNDVWQDGAVLVDFGEPQLAAYFTAFSQQCVPTDGLGNPKRDAHPVTISDDASMVADEAVAP
jgi:uncharacterized protein YukJ